MATGKPQRWNHWTSTSASLELPLATKLWVHWCRVMRIGDRSLGAGYTFQLARSLMRLLKIPRRRVVSINGAPTSIDLRSLETFVHVIPAHASGGTQESRIAKFVADRGVVLDVGANNGHFSLDLAASQPVEVHAFEPNEIVCTAFAETSRLRNLDNVEINQVAVGSESTTLDLFVDDLHDGSSTLVDDRADLKGRHRKERVPVTTLDEYCERRHIAPHDIEVVKVDVEGFESEVLRGASQLLSQGSPVLILEVSDETAHAAQHGRGALPYLQSFGYEYFIPTMEFMAAMEAPRDLTPFQTVTTLQSESDIVVAKASQLCELGLTA